MKNLKIRQKLTIGIAGQLVFIGLLAFVFTDLVSRLNRVSKNTIEVAGELNSLKEFTSNSKDFIHDKISYEQLTKQYDQLKEDNNRLSGQKEVSDIWNSLDSIKRIKENNIEIEAKVMELADESIGKSNQFINQMSQLLADENRRNGVSKLERLVIAGANSNNNNLYNIKVLFLNVKQDISNKDQLLSFLDQAAANALVDIERLKNTSLEGLPKEAYALNQEIIKLSGNYIANVEKMNELSSKIYASSGSLFKNLSEEDINNTNRNFAGIKSALIKIAFVLILISLILILLNYTVSKIVTYTFKSLSDGLDKFSDGDLTIEPPKGFENRMDEVGDLARSFIKSTLNLKKIISEINSGASNVTSASQQISATSQQMSQGASEQASSIEEVSSTMEEISANIQQNTDNAQQTGKISQVAQNGIEEVGKRAVKAVEANRVIAEKIKIINDIAFQTNILALNAAVEAARAGEHGKGFAVVASEVRKLAERSKIAAEEIVGLAQNSLELAEGAGEKMQQILPEVEKTTKLVQEIAAASLEQNNGATQVNDAIQQLNSIAQQNSAASEELATSAEEMASQAEQLKSAISYFKIDPDGNGPVKSYLLNNLSKRDNREDKREVHYQNSVGIFTGTAKKTADNKNTKNEKGIQIDLQHGDDKDNLFENF